MESIPKERVKMKKSILAMSLLFAVAAASRATTITDDFNRANTAQSTDTSLIGPNWKQSAGSANQWLISGNILHARPYVNPAIMYNDALQTVSGGGTNFTLSLDVSAKVPTAWAGVAFNYQDEGNFYYLRIKEGTSQYQLIASVAGNQTAVVLVNKSDASTTFDEDAFYTMTITSDTAHDFDFTITEVGSSTVLNPTATIIDSGNNFIGGYAGLYTPAAGGHNAKFDNFSLEVIPEPATLGLMGLVGAAAIFIRKRFMI